MRDLALFMNPRLTEEQLVRLVEARDRAEEARAEQLTESTLRLIKDCGLETAGRYVATVAQLPGVGIFPAMLLAKLSHCKERSEAVK